MPRPGPTMISCPACAGVVRAEVGSPDHLEFICSVGHAFSLEELYRAKEDQVEQVQWSLVAVLKHLQMILQFDGETAHRHVASYRPSDLQQRQEQVSHQISVVDRLITETLLPLSHEAHTAADQVTMDEP